MNKKIYEGKSRDIYQINDKEIVIVATDRISMHKVLPYLIKDKGIVLNKMAEFWFEKYKDIIGNHMITTDNKLMPKQFQSDEYKDRCMLAKKVKMFPFEIIVRGYITGSCWEEYKKGNDICGVSLPKGLMESQKLEEPIFTPTTKEQNGDDTNINYDEFSNIVGKEIAEEIKEIAIKIYSNAHEFLLTKGIILADTKMEFGIDDDNNLILADEILTPDCSRFWNKKNYKIGHCQQNYDREELKRYIKENGLSEEVRNNIPSSILDGVEKRYKEIYKIITD
ncbi:MAG: phosphoribosylaminoimidazolesuccinocarboxamide synthase [Clostridia bacterium]